MSGCGSIEAAAQVSTAVAGLATSGIQGGMIGPARDPSTCADYLDPHRIHPRNASNEGQPPFQAFLDAMQREATHTTDVSGCRATPLDPRFGIRGTPVVGLNT